MSRPGLTIEKIDRVIHEPARLIIMTILNAVESADFLYLQGETGLTKGNLSAHLSKLEEEGYIQIEKTYRGKIPLTVCRLTEEGRSAFGRYRAQWEFFMKKTRTMKKHREILPAR
jgi:DNA-binding MarR family transcriptional regulator